ncbi:MAG TPA: metallophosphoesterase [Myxococcota bacterium]|nr:metallophosphoesterase [Myxococcota bacterium]HOA12747.1 metallophosphoesterase [Myxococcota bacterium]HOC98304.1 metallophosphoesterase [Myxococcota bacterium]HOH77399.1 metallophosphoesterase [Myxococcota bacterium]
MRILFIGDIHGDIRSTWEMLDAARRELRIGAAVQVGDFGFFPEILGNLPDDFPRFPVPLYAIDGNHEDHAWLAACRENRTVEEWKRRLDLHYMERGSVTVIGGTRFGFLGGALHVDRPQEFDSASGSSNYIQQDDVASALERFRNERPDVIVTHSCPTGIGIGIHGSPIFLPGVLAFISSAGFDAGVEGDCGDSELTRLWNGLETRPKAWIFGHFHTDILRRVHDTEFVCVAGIDSRTVTIWDSDEGRLLFLHF